MMIVRDELDRYLKPVTETLLQTVDEIRAVDDGSTDGTGEWLESLDRVNVKRLEATEFYAHEGRARQKALTWAYKAGPTHLLAIDADELLENGDQLRASLAEDRVMTWSLDMEEIWKTTPDLMSVREDGGWRAHPVMVCYQYVRVVGNQRGWMIPDQALASGRVPRRVAMNGRRMISGAKLLHLGWACEADRQARYDRYVEHDSGKFHKSAHLDSIMWPDSMVRLRERAWPIGLDPAVRQQVYERTQKGAT